MSVARTSPPVKGPRIWCDPHTSFGKLGVQTRVWLQPPAGSTALVVAEFRAAVMQNAIAVHVRGFKNGQGLTRTDLATLDVRRGSKRLWDARLNGLKNLTSRDIATLLTVLPGAMPTPGFIEDFLSVAEGRGRPAAWTFPDT